MKWQQDVLDLLGQTADQIRELVSLHDVALEDATRRSRFRVMAKNVIENQRSALDYVAVGLTRQYGTESRLTRYPLVQNDAEFDGVIERNMKDVASAAPHVIDAIRRNQPDCVGRSWMRELNGRAAALKHRSLGPEIVRQTYQCRVTELETGSTVRWYGLRFEPGRIVSEGGAIEFSAGAGRPESAAKMVDITGPLGPTVFGVGIDYSTQRPFPDARLDVEAGPLEQWCFVNPLSPVLDELRRYQAGLAEVVADLVESVQAHTPGSSHRPDDR